MHPANLLSILDALVQELERIKRIDYAVNNVTTHLMFPSNVTIVYADNKLSISQDDTQVLNFRCNGKTSLLSQIAEFKQTQGMTAREFMVHRMRNEG